MTQSFQKLLAWAARNERPLGAVLFAFGFLTDIFTFGLLPIGVVNIFFLCYLALAAVATLGTHAISVFREHDAWWRKSLAVLFPLALQYAVGGILSGFVVFYTKNSFIAVSWPFLVLLVAIYIGNEYFRKHKEHLIFQTALFFFTLYAYAIFALPLYVDSIGPWVFAGSTAAAIILFAAFLYLLKRVNLARYLESRRPILIACSAIIVLVNGAYFSGIIPPIPLTLADEGIYHSVRHVGDTYILEAEAPAPWWDIRTEVVHHIPGAPLIAWSAIRAPGAFTAGIAHVWERKEAGKWVRYSRVAFPLSGGRADGYRGYSELTNVPAGEWRVTIETRSGQTIGRIRFSVEEATQMPPLTEVTL